MKQENMLYLIALGSFFVALYFASTREYALALGAAGYANGSWALARVHEIGERIKSDNGGNAK